MRTSAAAPSEMALELAAVTVPPSRNAGLSCGIFSGCLQREFVLADHALGFARFHGDRNDLCGEAAIGSGLLRPGERRQSKFVLLLARERVALRAIFGERAHQAAFVVCVFEAVEKHVVEHAAVAHAIAAARAVE